MVFFLWDSAFFSCRYFPQKQGLHGNILYCLPGQARYHERSIRTNLRTGNFFRSFRTILFVIVFTVNSISGQPQPIQEMVADNSSPVALERLEKPVRLDGVINEPAWEDIDPLPLTMHVPVYGEEPTQESKVKVAYTDDHLYVAGRFYEEDPDKIQAPYKERDMGSPTSDSFWLGLDTFNDNENALLFFVTPSGQRVDMALSNDGVGSAPVNINWDAFWSAEVVRNQKGWFTEMRIPISSLRFEDDSGRVVMGLVAGRWIARRSEADLFPAIPDKWGFWSLAKPSRMQDVVLEDIENRNPLYIRSYLLGGLGRSYHLNDRETKFLKDNQTTGDVGLDLKYGLTNNLTLDVSVNTDFAQVEADAQQVNLTRYSLFFPEKRGFFQERASNFEFNFGENNRLFHSRRIGIHQGEQVRIYGGARLVGRVEDWDVGVLNMQTQHTNGLPSENFGVVRLRKK